MNDHEPRRPNEGDSAWIQRELEKLGFKVNIARETDATFRQVAMYASGSASAASPEHLRDLVLTFRAR
jgi:hypothetical protein